MSSLNTLNIISKSSKMLLNQVSPNMISQMTMPLINGNNKQIKSSFINTNNDMKLRSSLKASIEIPELNQEN
ncbi:hypothetical protein CYY_005791 [Polysphondylium violaceum]|uniref:Uncharacterized protein n=1 Tax=Polysphondylium violaceum TaxID=133409 RepID=A0A8J4Q284_9MYCE|nr:hypothetical protein CYY_005791 [Polysphondylium violaceum]